MILNLKKEIKTFLAVIWTYFCVLNSRNKKGKLGYKTDYTIEKIKQNLRKELHRKKNSFK